MGKALDGLELMCVLFLPGQKRGMCVFDWVRSWQLRCSLWLACHQMALVAACFLQALLKCFQTILLLSRLSVCILHWQFSCGRLFLEASNLLVFKLDTMRNMQWRTYEVMAKEECNTSKINAFSNLCCALVHQRRQTSVEQQSCIEMRSICKSQDALGASYVNKETFQSKIRLI